MTDKTELTADEIAELDALADEVGAAIKRFVARKAELWEATEDERPYVREWIAVYETASVYGERTRTFQHNVVTAVEASGSAMAGLLHMGLGRFG